VRKRPSRDHSREGAQQDDFLSRVFADVKPLKPGRRRAPPPEPSAVRRPVAFAELPPRVRFVLERNEEYVSGYKEDLGPNALRALSSGGWQPQEVLDLHGRRVRGLDEVLARELRSWVRRGVRRVLIVHGKGLHSNRGMGVLAQAVIEALTNAEVTPFVRALKTAPARLGGSGALAVELEVVRARSR